MSNKWELLKERLGEITDLQHIEAVLGWDHQTYMPEQGAEERGSQLSTIARITHIKSTAPEVGELLNDLADEAAKLAPDSDDARLVKVAKRGYDKQTKVSADWVAEYARMTTVGQSSWQKARAEKDFSIFQPDLEKIVALRREYANFFAPYDHIYDPLLDDFEPGMKTSDVQEIFGVLRKEQVALLKEIMDAPQVDDSFFNQNYPKQQQWDFGVEVATAFGYDWTRGRQDEAAHPFTTTFGLNDVRITTRFMEDLVSSSMFSTMHEAGHGLYELGFDPALGRTPLADGASLAVHESQSRMWENLVGRSMPFWNHFYGRLQEFFPTQLDGVSVDTFYRGINKVEPSFIRVEADEATYNLHVMLRLELEIALMEGSLAVADLPEAWNARMQEYLGVTPPDDAKGVLQDVHWSSGLIGYFPTYALGNLISVQLWEKINEDMPDLAVQIEKGEFSELLGWLRTNIHRHGAKFEPQELVQKVTGSKIDPTAYLRYLRTKYSEIYSL
jgi:carboxypeptidase Taq